MQSPRVTVASPTRILSIDVLRGITIAFMILVNDPGDWSHTYTQLDHAKWNGFTLTDLVFPNFLFIVGASIILSLQSRIARGDSKKTLALHILRRSAIIFALDVFFNDFPHFHSSHLRIYGVLTRIALCYFCAGLICLVTQRARVLLAIVAALLFGYWALMRFVPVPGFGVPTHDIPLLDPDRNLAAWLDRRLLAGHLYEGTRDPEGVLSTIPAIATSLLGMLTAQWLRSPGPAQSKALGMALFGVIGVAAGKILDLGFPINKKLWTSSYVIFTAGLGLLCLAMCYWIADVRKWRGLWKELPLVFGMNAIAAYVFAGVISGLLDHFQTVGGMSWQELIYENTFVPLANPANASLLYALAYVLVCWVAMWLLYRKGIFLKI